MREIKFRGKSAVTSQWVYGYFLIDKEGRYNIFDGKRYHLIIAGTERQYTGLKDKNNTEIYEGDIVKAHLDEIDTSDRSNDPYEPDYEGVFYAEKDVIGEVKIRISGGTGIIVKKIICDEEDQEPHMIEGSFIRIRKDDEVIGNIYSNPELLNKT